MTEPIFLEGLVNTEDLGIDTTVDNKYHVSYSSSEVVIVDDGGNDTIVFEDVYAKKGHNINFFFDVSNDPDVDPDGVLFVIKDDKLQEYARCAEGLAPEKTFLGSMWIAAEIEQFKVRHGIDGEFVEVDKYFNKVTENVKGWFATYGDKYGNRALVALATCRDKQALKELISCYTKELCPIKLVETVLNESGYVGVRPNEFLGGSGNEVFYTYNDSIISAGKGNDKLFRGTYDHDSDENTNEIKTTNYVLDGQEGNDILEAGVGATLIGGAGENVIIVNGQCDETTTIVHGKGSDYINFVNATSFDDLEFVKNGLDLTIIVAESSEAITLKDYYKYNSKYSVKGISFGEIGNIKDLDGADYLYADDILRIVKERSVGLFVGTESVDTIKGSNNDDYIFGQGGNDKLSGQGGKNIFVFDINNLDSTITMGKGVDTIRFIDSANSQPEITEENFFMMFQYYNKGNDLLLSRDFGETFITIKNYLSNPEKSSVKYIEFVKDGNIYREELLNIINIDIEGQGNIKGTNASDEIGGSEGKDTIKAGRGFDEVFGDKGDDKLYGEFDDNKFYFYKGDGKDTIYAGKGEDTIVFWPSQGDVLKTDLSLSVDKNDLIIKYSNEDSIRLANYFTKGTSVNMIHCTNGEQTSVQELIDNTQIIIDGLDGKKNNLKGSGLRDVITGKDENDTLNGMNGIDEIYGNAGADIIKGGYGDDSIYGGKGNDKLYGEAGSDTFIFNQDDGNDIIYLDKSTESDTIRLDGINKETVSFSRKNNDLIIHYGNSVKVDTVTVGSEEKDVISIQAGENDDSITIANYFKTKNPTIDTIKTKNGDINISSMLDNVTVEDNYFYEDESYQVYLGKGKHYRDDFSTDNFIYATGKYAAATANNGNDIIQNNASFLAADGGAGNDIYISDLNRVTHIIGDASGLDIVKLAESKNDINFLFDVQINNQGELVDSTRFDGLFVINDKGYNSFKRSKNINSITKYLDCQKYFESDNNIDVFQAKDGYLTRNDLDALRKDVADWLYDNGYRSSYDAMLDKENKELVEDLYAIYQNVEWQPLMQ